MAESAPVQLLTKDGSEAQAFQREQMAALAMSWVSEMAPPGSPTSERLLADVIARARFEALLWSALADTLLQRPAAHVQHNQRIKHAAKAGMSSDERGAQTPIRTLPPQA